MQKRKTDLDALFTPKSIAIVGVPRSDYRFGGLSYLHKFQESGYPGKLYPINPKATEIRGVKAYPDLSSLPEVPDLVMVCLPAGAVLDVLQECARLGARHIHILTSGFREIGTEEGIKIEDQVVSISEEHGLLVMGPNCMGPYCPSAHLTAWGAIPGIDGPLGIISQSGTITARLSEYMSSLGLGVAKAVSFGNAAVLNCLDYLAFMAEDDKINVIAMYLETVPDGREFFELAREVNRKKPVVMLKGGESEVGAITAASHTGSIAGSQHMWEAFYHQTGVTRVESMDDWADAILSLALLPAPSGKNVFLICGGGGNSVIAGDMCIREGLDVPPLSEATMDKLREALPAVGSIPGNPLDDWWTFENIPHFAEVLEWGYQDPAINMIVAERIVRRKTYHVLDMSDPTPALIEVMQKNGSPKPTVFTVDCAGGDPDLASRGAELIAQFCKAGIPAFPSHKRSMKSMLHLHRYHTSQ